MHPDDAHHTSQILNLRREDVSLENLSEKPSEREFPNFSASAQEDFSESDFARLAVTKERADQFGVSATTFASWRWQMRRQLERVDEVENSGFVLSASEKKGFADLNELFVAGVTPYYASLMRKDSASECPIRLQSLPRAEELTDRLGVLDPLDEVGHSPVKEVVHVYPDRVAFCVAQLCPVYCRYCYRKRRDYEHGLHFNRRIIDRGLEYIAANPSIRDVLLTGGDAFLASDEAIDSLLARLREIKHVEIIRFGTRTPVTLPYRVTEKLAKILAKYHPIWVNTHFNCSEELTDEAKLAVDHLLRAGIPVGNQSVLLSGVNDTPERMMALLRGLLQMRVRPYYLFHPHLVAGTEHLRVSVAEGWKIMRALRGKITGMAIPTYVVDTPSGKVPLTPNHVLGQDGEDLLLADLHGKIWRERGAFQE